MLLIQRSLRKCFKVLIMLMFLKTRTIRWQEELIWIIFLPVKKSPYLISLVRQWPNKVHPQAFSKHQQRLLQLLEIITINRIRREKPRHRQFHLWDLIMVINSSSNREQEESRLLWTWKILISTISWIMIRMIRSMILRTTILYLMKMMKTRSPLKRIF